MAKPKNFTPLPQLQGSQAKASRPDGQVWLSASAGAGKTQVLTGRVLRLLLNGADPEAILCLTFTKAGAAEMADRIHERLGAWVTLPDADLRKELFKLDEPHMDNRLADARQLFAKVLDARGGGLRIQTIHAFAQTVLAAFPAEAGLTVGFRPVEGREEMQLKRQALGELVSRAEREGRMGTIDRLQMLALRIGEDPTRKLLDRCAQSSEAMEALGSGDFGSLARRLLSGGIDDIQGWLEANCADDLCDTIQLTFVRDANAAWMTKTGTPRADGVKSSGIITDWLKADAPGRVDRLATLRLAWRTGSGDFRKATPDDVGYQSAIEALDAWVAKLLDMKRALDLAPAVAAALELGQEYARVYADTKRAAGVVDFNDMIRATLKLLKEHGIGDWIRFKLDQSIDHILVDEAQDTNAEQWDIVKALSEEFFAGEGTKPDKVRTVFAVGDFKQAIFGFQGTNPEKFAAAGKDFRDYVEAVEQDFHELTIDESFRSSQPILNVVDAVMTDIGEAELGLPDALRAHKSARDHSGYVELIPPMRPDIADDLADDEASAEEDWLAPAELKWAEALAKKVKHWTSGGQKLDKEGRDAEPGDVMILLRSRSELARLIVSRLYEEKVPVAGVDRLRLDAPIAVQDLMACIRFVLQPEDDLSLASLLVSPLVGLAQEELFQWAHGRKVGLWQHLRAKREESELFVLRELLAMADRTTPYAFLEAILSGPIHGRAKMLARLGEEARDPIEELLNAALQFESTNTPSLQLFLDWFCRGEVDIKRDSSKRENAVRVMTVHGSKGLQAPIVVLADATSDPDFKKSGDLDWVVEDDFKLPLFRPKKDERFGSLAASAEVQDKRERQEHWRLLYVAMTRAEERLYIGGALKPSQAKEDKVLSEQTWHKRVEAGMRALPETAEAEDGTLTLYGKGTPKAAEKKTEAERWDGPLPVWATRAAPEEARPPRPLAPSALGVTDAAASPPPDPAMRAAAERGRILHALFERLPAVRPEDRVAAAKRWLSTHALDDVDALIADALAVIDQPELAYVFAPDALAEAPLAGVVDGQVIAGTVDRLIVTDTHVTVVDYKTGRRVPTDEAAVPDYHKAQMAAYTAVLEGIFPGRAVCAALLYTAGPKLITLSAETLAAWRPGHIAA